MLISKRKSQLVTKISSQLAAVPPAPPTMRLATVRLAVIRSDARPPANRHCRARTRNAFHAPVFVMLRVRLPCLPQAPAGKDSKTAGKSSSKAAGGKDFVVEVPIMGAVPESAGSKGNANVKDEVDDAGNLVKKKMKLVPVLDGNGKVIDPSIERPVWVPA